MGNVTVKINPSGLVRVVGPIADRAAYKAAQKCRGYVLSNIISAGRVNTGRMMSTMQVRKTSSSALDARYSVWSPLEYTMFQNAGTRAHGPRRAEFMVFTPKGGGGRVFAKWVRGVTPAKFMERAVARMSVSDFT